jgi:hypothetical protein
MASYTRLTYPSRSRASSSEEDRPKRAPLPGYVHKPVYLNRRREPLPWGVGRPASSSSEEDIQLSHHTGDIQPRASSPSIQPAITDYEKFVDAAISRPKVNHRRPLWARAKPYPGWVQRILTPENSSPEETKVWEADVDFTAQSLPTSPQLRVQPAKQDEHSIIQLAKAEEPADRITMTAKAEALADHIIITARAEEPAENIILKAEARELADHISTTTTQAEELAEPIILKATAQEPAKHITTTTARAQKSAEHGILRAKAQESAERITAAARAGGAAEDINLKAKAREPEQITLRAKAQGRAENITTAGRAGEEAEGGEHITTVARAAKEHITTAKAEEPTEQFYERTILEEEGEHIPNTPITIFRHGTYRGKIRSNDEPKEDTFEVLRRLARVMSSSPASAESHGDVDEKIDEKIDEKLDEKLDEKHPKSKPALDIELHEKMDEKIQKTPKFTGAFVETPVPIRKPRPDLPAPDLLATASSRASEDIRRMRVEEDATLDEFAALVSDEVPQQELEQRFKNASASIRDARQGIERLEHQVSSVPPLSPPKSFTPADDTNLYVKVPVPRLWISEPSPSSRSTGGGFFYKLFQGNWKFTSLGFILFMSMTWYVAETTMCEAYCHPKQASGPVKWSYDDPFFPWAIPTKIDQWTGRWVASWWEGR